jgi:hypothetical protein
MQAQHWRGREGRRIIAALGDPMKLVCVGTAVMLSLAPVGTVQARAALSWQGAATPQAAPSVLGSKDERVGKAAGFYEKGRFVEAALEFEGLVQDFPNDANFRFNAAVSRYGAGHYAHTIAYTRQYLASGSLKPEDRKEAEAQLNEALRKAVTVRVTVRGPADGSAAATIVARHVARASSDIRPDLEFPVTLVRQQATVALELDPGAWQIVVTGRGYADHTKQVELTPGTPSSLEVALVPAVADIAPGNAPDDRQVPREVVRKMVIGSWAAGGVVTAIGIALPIAGAVKINKLENYMCNPASGAEDPYAQCRTDFRNAYRTRDVGMAVLGGGIGLLAGGMTWMIKGTPPRRTAFAVEGVIGGVALVGGFASLFATTRSFNEINRMEVWSAADPDVKIRAGGHAVSMFTIGLGAGLLTTSLIGLGVTRKHTGSLRAGAMTGPGQAGLTLSGKF